MGELDSTTIRKQLQDAGRYLLENGLTWGNAGNLSARLDANHCLITASGTHLGDLADEDFVECPLNGSPESYPRKPSKELPMHRAVYAARPEVMAVLHGSPFYSTLFACTDLEVPADLFVEDMYYLERVARVPYVHPGAAALGDAVAAEVGKANILFLNNHGVLAYDSSVREALMGLHTLEFVCRMVLTALSSGVTFRRLPAETVKDFLDNSGYRKRRSWPLPLDQG